MQAEGSLWRGLGMLVAGGGLRSAVLLLRKVGMPDCAQALAQAVAEAQLDSKQGSADAGEIQICISTMQLCMPDVAAYLTNTVAHADQWLTMLHILQARAMPEVCLWLCMVSAVHSHHMPDPICTFLHSALCQQSK